MAATKVAVATDRSAGGDHAVRWAVDLAGATGADLLVIQVLPTTAEEEPEPPGTDDAAIAAELRALAGECASTAPDRSGAPVVESDVRRSEDVAGQIVDAAERWGADLLVVGNSGMRGRTQFLLGNVANRVSHLATCSVLIANSASAAGAGDPCPPGGGEPAVDGVDPSRAATVARELLPVVARALDPRATDARENARKLREALERLGPTFSKIGQILSTRPDLLSPEAIAELSKLRSSVPPMSEEEVVTTMEAELGVPWEDVFSSIEPEPLAAGTIGQVHRASLSDGSHVVVKVQRPAAAPAIEKDLALLERVARQAARIPRVAGVVDLPELVAQLGASLRAELDFGEEAANLDAMAAQLERYDHISVPRCHHELSTARLLVMDEVPGSPLGDDPVDPPAPEVARELLWAFFQQVLDDGVFHADPHPGNLLWDGEQLWMIDLGMVGRLASPVRRKLVVLLVAASRGESTVLRDVVLSLAEGVPGQLDSGALEDDLAAMVGRMHGRGLAEVQLAEVLDDLTTLSLRHRLRLPTELVMVGKALAQVQLSVTALDPTIDPLSEAGRFFLSRLSTRALELLDPERAFFEVERLRFQLGQVASGIASLASADPSRALQVRFSSGELEDRLGRAGRTAGLGLAAGLAWIAAASARDRSWARSTAGVAAGLTGLLAVESLGHRLRRRPEEGRRGGR